MNVAIVSDSHSGITKHNTTGINIFILQVPILLNGELKPDMETISFSKFDKMIYNNYKIECNPTSAKAIKEIWNNLLMVKKYDYIIHIPYSSMLGDMYEICYTMSQSYNGKVIVVDNKRLGVTLKSALFSAKNMAKKGIAPKEIANTLTNSSKDSSLYILIDNPKYVKNNCKLEMTKEANSALSSPKPIFELKDGILDLSKKCRSRKKALKIMLKNLEKDLKTKFKPLVDANEMELFISYSSKIEECIIIKEKLNSMFPNIPVTYTDELPICLCTHFGLGSVMIGCSKVFKC
ncbi:MAG: DegV family EDD domain-containing protein [Clostridia bacterium]|nr:DegV family EDD domain-containing protein [Clostridia bacterium]